MMADMETCTCTDLAGGWFTYCPVHDEPHGGAVWVEGFNAALDKAAKIIEAKIEYYDGAYERLLTEVRDQINAEHIS